MRVRLSVGRQIQLAELLAGMALLVPWLAILLAWDGDEIAVPYVVAMGSGIAAYEIVRRTLDRLLPGRPRKYRRPIKAGFLAALLAAAAIFAAATFDPYLSRQFVEGITPRHAAAIYVIGFGVYGFTFMLWPPDPIAQPASVRKLLRLDEGSPPADDIEPVDTPHIRWPGGNGPRG